MKQSDRGAGSSAVAAICVFSMVCLIPVLSRASDCDRPPPKCPAKSSAAFDPMGGDTIKRGVRRIVRVGDVFSHGGGEAGNSALKIAGQNHCGLWIENHTEENGPDGPEGKRIGNTTRKCLHPDEEGAFRITHSLADYFMLGDSEKEKAIAAAQSKTKYALRQINSNCFGVTLESDIVPYEGE
jgi:hypothetical protein